MSLQTVAGGSAWQAELQRMKTMHWENPVHLPCPSDYYFETEMWPSNLEANGRMSLHDKFCIIATWFWDPRGLQQFWNH